MDILVGMPKNMPKVVVVGVGNELMGDEGFGVRVVEELRKIQLPKCVEVYNCGTLGLQILNYLENSDFAIIVDVVKSNGKPGDIYVFDFEECKDYKVAVSLHDIDLVKAVKIGRLVYNLPKKIVVVGVEPERIELSMELSEAVKYAIPRVIDIVIDLIDKAIAESEIRYTQSYDKNKVHDDDYSRP